MSDKPLTDITFDSFDLHPLLLAGLEAAGFTRCTPIQALTLPLALGGRDVAGQAQTGTGKTLAFLVAVIDRLLKRPALADRKAEDPRALILAPTRELAIQIHKDAVKFESLTYLDVLKKELKVMDATAISLCKDNQLPIIVYSLRQAGNLRRIVTGERVGTIVKES